MKKIFALSLMLSLPLCAMDTINTYIEMFASAAANNKLEWLRVLANSSFAMYIDDPNALGATPLYLACQEGHIEIVRYLLDTGRPKVSKELMLGLPNKKTPCTALHIAAAQGHMEIVEALLDAKSTYIDSQHAPKNRTPLHYAIAHGHTKIAALLLTKKANYVSEDEDENTPLSLAAKCEYNPALTEVLSKGNILKAAYEGLATEISGFIAIKANLEETSADFKATPLIWAANNGHANVVKLLLDAGANIHAKNKDGLTALDCAKKRNKHEAVAILEEALKKTQDLDDKGKDEATN